MQFTTESALAGNDLATLPDFPAEIRAPAGTLAGVSAFQLNFSSSEVFTPGDDLDVLVAMNPAALKANLDDLKPGGILIVDQRGFNEQNLKKAELRRRTRSTDGSLDALPGLPGRRHASSRTTALKDMGLSARAVFRCRNFFCLGMTSWLYHRPHRAGRGVDRATASRRRPSSSRRTCARCSAGYNFAENDRAVRRLVRGAGPRRSRPASTGTSPATRPRRSASSRPRTSAGRPLFLGSYPITPASDILHELSAPEALRRLHVPGRGRDRRHRRGARRGVRRRDRASRRRAVPA